MKLNLITYIHFYVDFLITLYLAGFGTVLDSTVLVRVSYGKIQLKFNTVPSVLLCYL